MIKLMLPEMEVG